MKNGDFTQVWKHGDFDAENSDLGLKYTGLYFDTSAGIGDLFTDVVSVARPVSVVAYFTYHVWQILVIFERGDNRAWLGHFNSSIWLTG